MWKFTAEYEDWNGNPKKRELLFNLTMAEMMALQNSVKGGIETYYQRILDEQDNVALYQRFEDLVKLSYGVKSDDGERFIKNDEVYNNFKESAAYDVFMQYLLTTEDGASKFISGIMPAKVKAKLNTPEGKKLAAEHGLDTSSLT
ncbi:MAG: hypothetical protein J6S67_10955 [Methanobrevibacter sp.]|nr:hypothetical protein [Methanobrevibacter sp.]